MWALQGYQYPTLVLRCVVFQAKTSRVGNKPCRPHPIVPLPKSGPIESMDEDEKMYQVYVNRPEPLSELHIDD